MFCCLIDTVYKALSRRENVDPIYRLQWLFEKRLILFECNNTTRKQYERVQ